VNLTLENDPVDDGLDNGTLEIASDSPGEELISIALSGTGVPVQVNACVPVVDPASLQFGSVELGNTLALTTAVTNNGTLECAVNAAVSSTSGEFSLVSAVMFTVAPGASVNVEVNYAPADPGDDAGQLALTFPDRSISVPEYKKDKSPVTQVSIVFSQSVIAIHSAQMTNSLRIPSSSHKNRTRQSGI